MTFKFGELVRNVYASERNPTRDGFFVREFVRRGRLNPGHICEVTNGKGKFWLTRKENLVARGGGG